MRPNEARTLHIAGLRQGAQVNRDTIFTIELVDTRQLTDRTLRKLPRSKKTGFSRFRQTHPMGVAPHRKMNWL
jgi:hypothetical protein